jgi:hypothetical protein
MSKIVEVVPLSENATSFSFVVETTDVRADIDQQYRHIFTTEESAEKYTRKGETALSRDLGVKLDR